MPVKKNDVKKWSKEKFNRCVEKVRSKGDVEDPDAVCADVMWRAEGLKKDGGKKGTEKKEG